jgi:hypothetical protein
MKKHFKLILLLFSLFIIYSCNEEKFNNTFTDVNAIYYGRTELGYTFETQLVFSDKDKDKHNVILTLWSTSQELENCTYEICPDIITANFSQKGVYVNKTFARDCKWNGNLITDGIVTVSKENGKYSFILDLIDNTGEKHKGQFKGTVSATDKSSTSQYKGLFTNIYFGNSAFSGYKLLIVDCGNLLSDSFEERAYFAYSRQVGFRFPLLENDPMTGVYDLTNSMFSQRDVRYNCNNNKIYQIVSGTLTIERVNEPYKFKVCVDYIDENGEHLAGCFDGGLYTVDYE